MLNTQRLIRSGLALGAVGVLALGLATPAYAEGPVRGKVGTVAHDDSEGEYKNRYLRGTVKGDSPKDYPVGILGITIPIQDGQQHYVYCIEIQRGLNLDSQDGIYQETTWDEATHIKPGHLNKINWILHNSFPTKTVDEVLEAAGQQPEASLTATRRQYLVYAATQAAIWNLSDGFVLTGAGDDHGKGVFSPEEYAQIKQIYDYLLGVASKTPKTHTLDISPDVASGPAGSKVGPYEVASTVGEIDLKVRGGKAVDADGAEITKAYHGSTFWLTRDEVGEVTVEAKGYGIAELSRVFVHHKTPNKYQKVILPASKKAKVSDKAKATFTAVQTTEAPPPVPTTPPAPTPPPSLPVTGVAVYGLAGVGALLLAVGTSLLFLRRRSKFDFEA